jgi:hypothetical protein
VVSFLAAGGMPEMNIRYNRLATVAWNMSTNSVGGLIEV